MPAREPDAMELDDEVSTPTGKAARDDLFTAATKNNYKFWCFIKGDSTVFRIKASAENDGYDLKEMVREKKNRYLGRVDASDLVVSKVNAFFPPLLHLIYSF